MKKDDTYKLGDIVRWKDSKIIEGYEYGMVIKAPSIVRGGVYKFANEVIEILDIQDSSFCNRRAAHVSDSILFWRTKSNHPVQESTGYTLSNRES